MLKGGRAFLVVVLAVTLLGMTACGSSPTGVKEDGAQEREKAAKPATPVETVKLAYETTAKAESAKFSMRSVFSGLPQQQGAPQSFTMTGEGSLDFQGKNARLVMRMPMLGEMEMRYIGSKMYQKMPEAFAAGAMPQGKKWVEIDLEKMMQEQFGASPSEMQGGMQGAPSDQLSYLRGVSDSVQELGTEQVRGVPTKHYRADVDLDKAAPKDPKARQAYKKTTEGLHAKKIPTEIWLDKEGRVRRYEMTMPVSFPQGASQSEQGDPTMTMTAEYYDFGTPVHVQPPPKDQTIPFEKLKEIQEQHQQQQAQRQQRYSAA